MKKVITLVVAFALTLAPALVFADSDLIDPSSELDRRRGPDPGPDPGLDPGPDPGPNPGPGPR